AHKLAPKYIGPFWILEDYRTNSYLLNLPQGFHSAFHASLLCIHKLNDKNRFPGHQLPQVSDLGKLEEYLHHRKGVNPMFEVMYDTGDRVWLPYYEISKLEALGQYLEAQGAL
ncbi:hypothetical protein BDN67DRAFT_910750, partial [Paxillus ammoniavirescens]